MQTDCNPTGWQKICRHKIYWKSFFSKRYDWSFSLSDGLNRIDLKKPHVPVCPDCNGTGVYQHYEDDLPCHCLQPELNVRSDK